ncbi:calcium-translocating P-type ATPase [Diplocarpon rosae]|nr:calcium-translocating P-type ATPase [Diplocarpon rosae]
MLGVPRIQTGGLAAQNEEEDTSGGRPRATSDTSFLSAQSAQTLLAPGTPGGASMTSSITFHDADHVLAPDPGTEADFEVQDNKFAFSPGHLNKLLNPKSLAAFTALGGLAGIERGLRTDIHAGLSIDEGALEGTVSFHEATKAPEGKGKSDGDFAAAQPGQHPGSYSDRIRIFNQNVIPTKKATPLWKLMWIAYQDKVLILLTGAAVISLSLGKERAFVKLNAKIKQKDDREVKVIRSGKSIVINVHDVLVGDVLHLEPGDMIPADGIFISGHNVKCDESSATGESDSLRKTAGAQVSRLLEAGHTNHKNLDPFIISGAKVLEGVGTYLVTSVGVNSSFGKIMMSMRTEPEETPLQVKLGRMAGAIAKLGSSYVPILLRPLGRPLTAPSAAGLLFFVLLFRFLASLSGDSRTGAEKASDFTDILIVAITIIVVYVSLLLSTLTGGAGPGHPIQTPRHVARGAVPEGLPLAVTLALAFATTRLLKDNNLVRILKACEVMGNATTVCSDKTGTLTTNKMAVVAGTFGSETFEADSVAAFAAKIPQDMRDLVVQSIATIATYAQKSLRTIGLTFKDFPAWPPAGTQISADPSAAEFDQVFNNMTFSGVVGIQDPVRPGVPEAVAQCQFAGVKVRMVTGDNIITARAIARECGIVGASDDADDLVMEGPEFRKLSDAAMLQILPRLAVLARSSPQDKQILVQKLRSMSETVAVTGDGTNDGPALKAADVGFSMGIAGTEVAKEASAIILMDDNFASIVKALMWGRAVNDAVAKFLQFQLTVNITAVTLAFVSAVASSKMESVLTAVQLLWVNLIMDTFAALALATDPPTPEILNRKPAGKKAPLITMNMWKMIIGQAIFQLVVTFVLHFAGEQILGYDTSNPAQELELNTMVFNTFVWMQIFNEFNNRRLDNKFNIFVGLHRNFFFIAINFLMVGLQIAIIFIGGEAFSITRLDGVQWAICLVLASLSLPMGILVRLFPDPWFARVALTVGGPFATAYRAGKRLSSRMWSKVPSLRQKQTPAAAEEVTGETTERVPTPPVVVTEHVPEITIEGAPRDEEKGRIR